MPDRKLTIRVEGSADECARAVRGALLDEVPDADLPGRRVLGQRSHDAVVNYVRAVIDGLAMRRGRVVLTLLEVDGDHPSLHLSIGPAR